MQYIQGTNRNQAVLFNESLDQIISFDNEVRLIDLFAESIIIEDFGFVQKLNTEGRPAYNPKDLLKLFIYGYLNSMRSSRVLEKECRRNIEVMWLMKQLVPDHNTISNFRRDNEKAIRKVFRYTVSIAKEFDLIGGKLIAGDSTKLRAQNSKKNNFNQKKIERHLQYIDNKLAEYTDALRQADDDKDDVQQENQKIIEQQISKHENRKEFYHALTDQLKQTGELQISLSDPDSRQMITRNDIIEVAYNVQTTVDAKNKLIIDYKVTNTNDNKAMGGMLRRAKTILKTNDITALYDKGYHAGSELKTACEMGIETLVAIPDKSSASMIPEPAYNVSEFIYDAVQHTYTCPQNQVLKTNGNWYKKDRNARGRKHTEPILMQRFKTTACNECPALNNCTKNTGSRGRVIERSEYQNYVDQNKINIQNNAGLYRKRQEIVEHPYGIIKRQWGFYYITTKRGIKRASADVGLMLIAFNLRRLFNIIDKKELFRYLMKKLILLFAPLQTNLASIYRIIFFSTEIIFIKNHFNKLIKSHLISYRKPELVFLKFNGGF
ncbi:MAG: IS1182 family transposase [Chitinophagales bacterium]|nr:IS1182 family transposase [Bacteroidota bacterium]MBK8681348.1 IS1182 family transposase [Bacteroidota bacterium]